jgi:hypothetical protein
MSRRAGACTKICKLDYFRGIPAAAEGLLREFNGPFERFIPESAQRPSLTSVSVRRRQKTAPLGAVFGALSTAPYHVGLVALNSFYALAPKPFTVPSLYALAVS